MAVLGWQLREKEQSPRRALSAWLKPEFCIFTSDCVHLETFGDRLMSAEAWAQLCRHPALVSHSLLNRATTSRWQSRYSSSNKCGGDQMFSDRGTSRYPGRSSTGGAKIHSVGGWGQHFVLALTFEMSLESVLFFLASFTRTEDFTFFKVCRTESLSNDLQPFTFWRDLLFARVF